jgi:predicted YcjX-like family ATPase
MIQAFSQQKSTTFFLFDKHTELTYNISMADNIKKLTEAEEANIQKLVKSYNDYYYGESAKVVYKTESEMYEEYCDENDLL